MTGRQRRSRRTDTPLPYTTLSRSLARPLNLQKLEPGQEAFRVIRRFCSFGCNFVPEFFQKGTFKPQHALIADQPVRTVRLDHLRGEPLPVPPGETALEVIVEKLRRTGADRKSTRLNSSH